MKIVVDVLTSILAVGIWSADGRRKAGHVPGGHRRQETVETQGAVGADPGQKAERPEGDLDFGTRPDPVAADRLGDAHPLKAELEVLRLQTKRCFRITHGYSSCAQNFAKKNRNNLHPRYEITIVSIGGPK